jgi:hypothetical protein
LLYLACLFLGHPERYANIVPISISGSVSGSGVAFANTDLTSASQNLSFSDPSSGSGSAMASAIGTLSNEDASVEASASQFGNVGDTSIEISTQSSGSGSETGLFLQQGGYFAGANALVTNDLSIEFELTGAYLVQLSGSMAMVFDQPSPLNCGGQDVFIAGFDFSNDCNQMFRGIGGQLLLTPGVYTISASSSWNGNAVGGFGNPHEFTVSGDISFTANFTPVPEPRWGAMLAAPLAMCVYIAARRPGCSISSNG